LRFLHRVSSRSVFAAFFASVILMVRSRTALQLEVLALRHQLGVLQRSVKRPRLTTADRLFWIWLSRIWPAWRSALVIVKPDTVVAWHRTGFPVVLGVEVAARPCGPTNRCGQTFGPSSGCTARTR